MSETKSVTVTSDDLRIIGHAISWVLEGNFEHSRSPKLTKKDKGDLQIIFGDICQLNRYCLTGERTALIRLGDSYWNAGDELELPERFTRLLVGSLASFCQELSGSPTELEALTGLPSTRTVELLAKLEKTFPKASPIFPEVVSTK